MWRGAKCRSPPPGSNTYTLRFWLWCDLLPHWSNDSQLTQCCNANWICVQMISLGFLKRILVFFQKKLPNYSSNLSRFFKMTYQNSMIWVVLDKVFCYLVIKALTPRQMLAQSTVWFLPTSQSQQSYMSYQHLLALIFFFSFNWHLIHVYQTCLYVLNYLYLQWPNPFFPL